MSVFESLSREGRMALRRLVARPGGALATVFLIVLGAAPLIAVLALYARITTGELPYEHADRLVHLTARADKLSWDLGLSRPLIDHLRTQTPSLEAVGGFEIDAAAYGGRDGAQTEEITLMRAQPGVLDTLALAPAELPRDSDGRTRLDGGPALLLTASFARRVAGEPSTVIGQTLRIDGTPVRVAGVLPADFRFPSRAVDAWLLTPETPEQIQPAQAGNFTGLALIGRLAPGVSLASLQEEMSRAIRHDPMVARMVDEIGLRVSAHPLRHYWFEADSLRAVLAVAIALFLVALVNALGLSLLRAWARRQELALVQALGANRLDVHLRALTEAAILVGLAVVISMALVPLVVRALLSQGLAPPDLPIALAPGSTVLLTAAGVGVLSLVCLSLGDALVRWLAKRDSLAAGARKQTETRRGKWISAGFATTQLALGACVLHLALLTSQNASALVDQDFGYPRDDLWVVGVDTYSRAVDDAEIATRRAALDSWIRQVSETSGVAGAAFASAAPLGETVILAPFKVPSAGAQDPPPSANVYYVGASYFDVLGVPLLSGRPFNTGETRGEHPVAVIDERIARRHFGKESPLGRSLMVTGTDDRTIEASIVGVVAESRQRALSEPDEYPSIYLPREVPYRMAGLPTESFEMLVRAEPAAQLSRQRLSASLTSLDGNLRLSSVDRMSQRIEQQIASLISLRNVLSLLSGVVLFLTCAGLYATVAARVETGRREFGIRKSLGATAARIFVQVLRFSLGMVAAALVLALPLTQFAGSGLIESVGQGLRASHATYGLVVVILLSAGTLAVLAPAWRASTTQPGESLRDE